MILCWRWCLVPHTERNSRGFLSVPSFCWVLKIDFEAVDWTQQRLPPSRNLWRVDLFRCGGWPEPWSWMKSRAQSPPGGLRGEIGGERGNRFRVVAWVVRELHRYRLRRPLRDRSVQLLNCPFGFDALVESDESDALWQAWNTTVTFIHAWNRKGGG